MSNASPRKRRTVPLDGSGHNGAQYAEPIEDGSLRTSSVSAGRSSRSSGSSRSKRNSLDGSRSRRRSGRNSLSKSGHSRGSSSSAPVSISTEELKKSLYEQNKKQGVKSAGANSDMFTIGNSSTPQTRQGSLSSVEGSGMADLFGLEQTLQETGIATGFGEGEPERHGGSRAPVAWKTPFEVDAPRGPSLRTRRSGSPTRSVASAIDPHLSEEQDAWAGIDALLETESFDDSFTFSTTDILPYATVKAMRRDNSTLEEESVVEDDLISVADRSLHYFSKNASSKLNRKNGNNAMGKGGSFTNFEDKDDSWIGSDEARDQLGQLRGSGVNGSRGSVGELGGGGLFDMFHWSEKDNVDEERRRKTKLNSRQNKRVQLQTNSDHTPTTTWGGSGHDISDTASLPSLATIQADDYSTHSGATSLGSYTSREVGSVVSSQCSEDDIQFDSIHEEPEQMGDTTEAQAPQSVESNQSKFAGDGLVLDKGVDEYIRKMQRKLPTINEGDADSTTRGKRKGRVSSASVDGETSPSPTSVADETTTDQLPSLTSYSGGSISSPERVQQRKSQTKTSRWGAKKEPKPSLSFQLKSSIDSIRNLRFKARAPGAKGDEEKYFPSESKSSNLHKADQSLLSGGDDGVNWDND